MSNKYKIIGALIVFSIGLNSANAQYMDPYEGAAPANSPTVKNLTNELPVPQHNYLPQNFKAIEPVQNELQPAQSNVLKGGEVIELSPQPSASFEYLSGGIGADEVASMQAQKSNYNFYIMSADKSGHFTGEIDLEISDSKGANLFSGEAGPLFYAKLPNGTYLVEGEREGVIKKQKITINSGKSSHVHFGW